jgi:hypothetical protein
LKVGRFVGRAIDSRELECVLINVLEQEFHTSTVIMSQFLSIILLNENKKQPYLNSTLIVNSDMLSKNYELEKIH